MSDDVTDGFQTYEDAVQAHLDAKNGQNAVTFLSLFQHWRSNR